MKTLFFLAIALSSIAAYGQTHGHINAGAQNTNGIAGIQAGDKLFMEFEHGTGTTTLTQGSTTVAAALAARADGYAWTGYTTLTALHQSTDDTDLYYEPNGAMSGSFVQLQFLSLSGPIGAKIAFYEAGGSDPRWVYQVGPGFLLGDGKIDLTDPIWFDDDVLSDPFGHIHGRTFATDTAGNFTATWILHDREGLLLDSDPFTSGFTAAAVPEPATWLLLANAAGALLLRRRFKPAPATRFAAR